jgi:RNA polymerase sigma-70 factor (ECF subfamily)
MTFTDVDRLQAEAPAAAEAFHMDEDAFRAFYDRTARSVWVYLARATGDPGAADDLLQDVFYRFLRAGAACATEAHRRHYVFRVATNQVRDRHRRRLDEVALPDDGVTAPGSHGGDGADRLAGRLDLARAMARLRHRERDLLWLAYGEGASHEEIAGALGLRPASIKGLLLRARRRLAALLRPAPPAGAGTTGGGR